MTSTTKPEVVQLLRRINEGATSSQTPLGEVLRLCLRLGKSLGNRELSIWAKAEAEGYSSIDNLPDYRIFDTEVLGTFSGPFGKFMKNASIPKLLIEEGHRGKLFTAFMTQSVGELERLAIGTTDSNSITIPWTGDAILYYQQKPIYQGYVLVAADRIMTTTVVAGVLETIRTRVLEFVLAIEEELGIDAMNYDNSKKPLETLEQEKVHQIFNTTIQAGSNIAMGNTGTTNQYAAHVQPGDLQGLKEKLTQLGVTEELITDLDVALDKDADSPEQPGKHVQGWFGRLAIKAGQGTIQLISATAPVIVMAELRKFLGLPPV